MYVITGAELVADLGGHLIYTIRDTRLISVGSAGSSASSYEHSTQEQRYLRIFIGFIEIFRCSLRCISQIH